MPELEAVRRQFEREGVRFLALSLEPDEQLVLKAAQRLGIEMQVAVAAGEVLSPLGVNQVPSTVFIRDGTIVAAASGERKRAFFEKRVRELLAR